MQRALYYIVFLIQFQFSFSQSEKTVHGTVLSDDFPVQGVKIINLNTEKSIITNNNGAFMIAVKPDDLLVFYALEYLYKRKQVSEKDIFDDNLIVRMDKKPIVLKEVVVEKPSIDAVSLGIVSSKVKSYTPAERKLQEANSGVLTRLMNLASGRTKMLKKHLVLESNELLLKKLKTYFEDDYYTSSLKIEADLIGAFQYFAVENKSFVKIFKSKNKSLIKFKMTEMALEFKALRPENEVEKKP